MHYTFYCFLNLISDFRFYSRLSPPTSLVVIIRFIQIIFEMNEWHSSLFWDIFKLLVWQIVTKYNVLPQSFLFRATGKGQNDHSRLSSIVSSSDIARVKSMTFVWGGGGVLLTPPVQLVDQMRENETIEGASVWEVSSNLLHLFLHDLIFISNKIQF